MKDPKGEILIKENKPKEPTPSPQGLIPGTPINVVNSGKNGNSSGWDDNGGGSVGSSKWGSSDFYNWRSKFRNPYFRGDNN